MNASGQPPTAPDYVLTIRSLQACLERAHRGEWAPDLAIPGDGSWGVAAVTEANTVFVIHADDARDTARIVVMSQGTDLLGPVPTSSYVTALERVHRLAIEAEHPPISLPAAWSDYRADNKVAFFAIPRLEGALRWVAEVYPLDSPDTVFWRITTAEDQVVLEDYAPPYELYTRILAGWDAAYDTARARLADATAATGPEAVQPTVDLEETTFGAVTRYRTFSSWLSSLTDKQLEFLETESTASVKLRGPAGSGKTLALELKALKELYAARDRGDEPRFLFATHSWAMAEQVDAALRQLDETGDVHEIDVYPLISIAQAILPTERSGSGFSLLGEDSLSGRRLQIERLDDILDAVVASEWLFYADGASELLRSRVEAPRGSQERNSLVWDLMIEFASVLSAHGILPGINAERQYLALERTPWMMPLDSDLDKQFVLLIYTRYVEGLREAGILTTDQLINDFLNYLETFTWNIRRETAGYDAIFVDELHLFSDQERLVLHYLSRSPGNYPRMFMALDPRQSPAEMYVDVEPGSITRGDIGLADTYLGEFQSVELSTVHRFTPEILRIVRHINQMYPALGMGEDWSMDLSSVESSASEGPLPRLVRHASIHEEVAAVALRAAELQGEAGDERVAIVVLEPTMLPLYAEAAAQRTNVVVVAGRDQIDQLQYTRRSVVVGAVEYLAGLQFGRVIVAGLPYFGDGYANLGHLRRRLLSLLYLAVTRATESIEIHVSDDRGGVPDVLESAVESEALQVAA